jgi:hypothetical protein
MAADTSALTGALFAVLNAYQAAAQGRPLEAQLDELVRVSGAGVAAIMSALCGASKAYREAVH